MLRGRVIAGNPTVVPFFCIKERPQVTFDGYFRSYFCPAKLFNHEKGLQSPKDLILKITVNADFRFSDYWICFGRFLNFPIFKYNTYPGQTHFLMEVKKYVLSTLAINILLGNPVHRWELNTNGSLTIIVIMITKITIMKDEYNNDNGDNYENDNY